MAFLPQTLMDWANILTAIATAGAVFLSLHYSAQRKKKFRIKSITTSGLRKSHPPEETWTITVTIENCTEYKMEIKSAEFCFFHQKNRVVNGVAQPYQSSCGFTFENEIIAPLGVYRLKIPVEKEWRTGSLSGSGRLDFILDTSMGKISYRVPRNISLRITRLLESDMKEAFSLQEVH